MKIRPTFRFAIGRSLGTPKRDSGELRCINHWLGTRRIRAQSSLVPLGLHGKLFKVYSSNFVVQNELSVSTPSRFALQPSWDAFALKRFQKILHLEQRYIPDEFLQCSLTLKLFKLPSRFWIPMVHPSKFGILQLPFFNVLLFFIEKIKSYRFHGAIRLVDHLSPSLENFNNHPQTNRLMPGKYLKTSEIRVSQTRLTLVSLKFCNSTIDE